MCRVCGVCVSVRINPMLCWQHAPSQLIRGDLMPGTSLISTMYSSQLVTAAALYAVEWFSKNAAWKKERRKGRSRTHYQLFFFFFFLEKKEKEQAQMIISHSHTHTHTHTHTSQNLQSKESLVGLNTATVKYSEKWKNETAIM